MEQSYAQALWTMIEKGGKPAHVVRTLREILEMRGRMALMPRIARAFRRIAARELQKARVVLSVAHEKDAAKAKRASRLLLKEMGADEVEVSVDDSLIGGWRLEGRERMVDDSFKKHLLSLYNRATQ